MSALLQYTPKPTPTASSVHSFDAIQIELDRRKAGKSFAEFVKMAWHVVEPAKKLKWGWALDAICQHLEAVSYGQILRLLMNVPPGMMKSLLTCVFFPAWEWGPRDMAHLRYLGTSHKEPLAIRDNRKCRMLIQSKWYQDRWPVMLTSDQNEKKKFENDKTGFREAMAFTSLTGSRGDRVLLDDPLSADEANSEVDLKNVEIVFREQLPSRVNDEESAIIVIMQRLHEMDPSGIILAEDLGYTTLILPMRYDPERHCTTSIGFTDPRSKKDELLFPERFSEEEVTKLEKVLGIYATAGQLQQLPAPRDGGLFVRENFNYIDAEPECVLWVRGWDFASSLKKRADFTCSVKMGVTKEGRVIVADGTKDRLTPARVRKKMKTLAQADNKTKSTVIAYPQDPGQAGKDQKDNIATLLFGFVFRATPESGDKGVRVEEFSSQVEAGLVDIVKGSWNKEYVDELCGFPGARHDDYVDASSRAYNELARRQMLRKTTVGRGPQALGEAA